MKILVTGGAGFIGSHIVDGLISKGHEVRILDSLDPQVHGENPDWPGFLDPKTEKIRGSILDPLIVSKALENIDVVYHEAAAVGVGQSMYQIRHYTETNALGTAVLLEAIASKKDKIKKMIVASSMSIYGEGKYSCPACGPVFPSLRSEGQLREHKWEYTLGDSEVAMVFWFLSGLGLAPKKENQESLTA